MRERQSGLVNIVKDKLRAYKKRLGLGAVGALAAITLFAGEINADAQVPDVPPAQTDWPCHKPDPIPIAQSEQSAYTALLRPPRSVETQQSQSSVIFEGLPKEIDSDKAPHPITTCALIRTPFEGVGAYVTLVRTVCFADKHCDDLRQGPQIFFVADRAVIDVYINAYQMPPDATAQIYTVKIIIAPDPDGPAFAAAEKQYVWADPQVWLPIILVQPESSSAIDFTLQIG